MVLTQPDLEMKKEQLQSQVFPYHYGSHATVSYSMLVAYCSDVSIPLWFSRNIYSGIWQLLGLSFHTTMVLTQRVLYISIVVLCTCFHTTMVLTQPLTEMLHNTT